MALSDLPAPFLPGDILPQRVRSFDTFTAMIEACQAQRLLGHTRELSTRGISALCSASQWREILARDVGRHEDGPALAVPSTGISNKLAGTCSLAGYAQDANGAITQHKLRLQKGLPHGSALTITRYRMVTTSLAAEAPSVEESVTIDTTRAARHIQRMAETMLAAMEEATVSWPYTVLQVYQWPASTLGDVLSSIDLRIKPSLPAAGALAF